MLSPRTIQRGLTPLTLGFAALLFSAPLHADSTQLAQQEPVSVDGVAREYFVYTPKSYKTGQTVPVVFVLHPFEHDAAWAEDKMGWDQCADKNGFIVVYGQSGASNGAWNATITRSERATGFDDESYIQDVMDSIETSYSVDMSRVYLVGFSSGGIMTAKVASTIPKSLTAVATVEGMTGYPGNDMLVPPSPISAIMFRGTGDDVVPYSDSQTSSLFRVKLMSATQTASDWAAADGITSAPATNQLKGGRTDTAYTGGTNGTEIHLITVNGGKHVYDPADTDIIWKFFQTQTRATDKP